MCDQHECVVGIMTAKYSYSGVEVLGFAIPIDEAMTIANELIANGFVTDDRASFGVSERSGAGERTGRCAARAGRVHCAGHTDSMSTLFAPAVCDGAADKH